MVVVLCQFSSYRVLACSHLSFFCAGSWASRFINLTLDRSEAEDPVPEILFSRRRRRRVRSKLVPFRESKEEVVSLATY
jgi:hypothetical protein